MPESDEDVPDVSRGAYLQSAAPAPVPNAPTIGTGSDLGALTQQASTAAAKIGSGGGGLQSTTTIGGQDSSAFGQVATDQFQLQRQTVDSLPSFFGAHVKPDLEQADDFGHEMQSHLDQTRKAASAAQDKLQQLSSAINGGDTAAAGTADDILNPGEVGLDYFKYFLPAYNYWTGQHVGGSAYLAPDGGGWLGDILDAAGSNDLLTEYRQEYGMSFADYSADATLLGKLAADLGTHEQTLQSAYDTLVPTWQGQAASAFEAKMAVFFKGATAVQQDVGGAGKEVSALVSALQKVILAKAEAVRNLYADALPPGIDGAMAMTIAQIARGGLGDRDRFTLLQIFGKQAELDVHFGGVPFWAGAAADEIIPLSGPFWATLQESSRQAAISTAIDWCQQTLVPQTETRLQILDQSCKQTKQAIQQAFATVVSDLDNVPDPFAGIDSATSDQPKQHVTPQTGPTSPQGTVAPPQLGGGTGGPSVPSGGGGPTGGSPSVQLPTVPAPAAATGPTTPQGTGATPGTGTSVPGLGSTLPSGVDPGTGLGTGTATGRPSGLPTGAGWVPAGVPLPSGWTEDPTTGELLPQGWSTNPQTGQPVPPAGTGSTGTTGNDVTKNPDGSVSVGSTGAVTIGRDKDGKFVLTETDADGTKHYFTVHFGKDGAPEVTELSAADAAKLDITPSAAGQATTPAGIDVPSGGGGGGFAGSATVGGGGAAGGSGTGPLEAPTTVGDATGSAAAAPAAQADTAAAPAAAAGDQQQGQHGSGVGAMPMMAGRGMAGAGGGQGEESRPRYPQGHDDVVGEDELDEWRRMGPVVGG